MCLGQYVSVCTLLSGCWSSQSASGVLEEHRVGDPPDGRSLARIFVFWGGPSQDGKATVQLRFGVAVCVVGEAASGSVFLFGVPSFLISRKLVIVRVARIVDCEWFWFQVGLARIDVVSKVGLGSRDTEGIRNGVELQRYNLSQTFGFGGVGSRGTKTQGKVFGLHPNGAACKGRWLFSWLFLELVSGGCVQVRWGWGCLCLVLFLVSLVFFSVLVSFQWFGRFVCLCEGLVAR